jgi:exodeoxyribonuclease V beta subunit
MSDSLRYPRPAALAELGRDFSVVESSAGTGKTFLLEHLFVDLILNRGVSAEEILVVTFTEKAVAELVLRVRELIKRLVDLKPEDTKAIEAARAPKHDTWILDESACKRLQSVLLAFDRIGIYTIHGFCQRILREHAFVQGRFFDEEIVAEETAFRTAFREILRSHVAMASNLEAAIEAWLACGKSIANLEELLVRCNSQGVAVLHPRFDEARIAKAMAAWRPVAPDDEELKRHLKAAKVHGRSSPSIIARLARASQIVVESNGNVLPFLAAMDAFPDEPRMSEGLAFVLDRLPTETSDPTLTHLAQTIRELQEATVPLAAALAQMLLPLVRQRAAQSKRSAGLFDFSDMLTLVANALEDPGPASRALLVNLRQRYRHALIDEFQDTDATQWSIFRRIFVEANDGHGLTVIGDPKQAIYGFRSADIHTYLAASRYLQAVGGTHLVLDRNFRSTAALLEATNQIFDQRADFFRRESGITYEHPVLCGRDDLALVDQAGNLAEPVVVFGIDTKQDKLKSREVKDALLQGLVEELRTLIDPSCPLRLRSRERDRSIRARDVFVLTFTNAENHAVGRALGQARIPYAFHKQGDLFASSEAAETLSLLRAIAEPEDGNLRAHALLTRFFGLDLVGAASYADPEQAEGPVQLLRRFAALARESDIPALFAAIVDETGIVRREVFADRGERALTNVLHILEILQGAWARSHLSLPELADLLDAYRQGTQSPLGREPDLQRLETDKDAVQILTVHKAKGLEADVVFIFGGTGENRNQPLHLFHQRDERVLNVGRLGGSEKQIVDQEKQDERSRLLYVALTRARYRLYLPHYPAAFKTFEGIYSGVNQRLNAILGQDHTQPHPYFRVLRCDADLPHGPSVSATAPCEGTLPSPELMAIPTEPADLADIKAKRSGFLVTSYSAVKRARTVFAPADDQPAKTAEALPIMSQLDTAEALPAGTETGLFLHDLLASVSLPELARSPDFADWFAQPGVGAMVEKIRRRHARPASHAPLAARLVHTAYITPVRLGDAVMTGLATTQSFLREMEFLFPMPEHHHPLLSRPKTDGVSWKFERGVVRGFVDFLFQHEGKLFVCDWKSDILPSFDPDALALHCQQYYDVQACIYTLAILRQFGIATPSDYARRFGGIFFCFLRGRLPQDMCAGIHFRKPTWDEILAWETDMLGQSFWGIAW